MIENAAVFIGGGRRFRGVNVNYDETTQEVVVTNRTTGDVLARYSVVEVAKAGMAWDVDDSGTERRLVAQQGCGCSGQRTYSTDEGYSGRLAN